jgi:lipopolysaccharide/colanic/teichoic acid biosynthesis glycosyltransferase/GGDEF domain-containing protein
MMRLKSLLQLCFSPSDRPAACDWLLSVEQMQRILDRERMRSDRGTSSFSLVEFTFDSACKTHELSALAKIFRQRIRATDDAGRLSQKRVGIVLPETQADGAWRLAEDVLQRLPADVRRPECEVYTYPTQDETLDSGNDDGRATSAGERRGRQAASDRSEDTAPVDDSVAAELEADEVATQCVATEEAPVVARGRSMDAFFMRPLPAWKRAIDILGAGTAILVFSPLMLVIAALIKLTSPGPAIFKQGRDTIGGRHFTIYKFRTMCVDAESQKAALRQFSEQDGPAFKIARDPRITSIGRLLRITSLDELPQLFNVLLGHMSIVGPRPLPCDESRNCRGWHRRRLDVTPGLTCIWQVRGRSQVSFSDWVRMDIQYIKSRTLASDVKLIVQTVPAVLLHRGAC